MSGRSILAVFAHPDDEILGAGATLALHAARGDAVNILIMATGLASRRAPEANEIEALRDHGRAAAAVIGARSIEFLDYPDNRMDSVPLLDVIKSVEAVLERFDPDVIYTHHAGDLNVDHLVVHRAVLTARRPLPGRRPHEILAAEVNSSTEWGDNADRVFRPTDFVEVSETIEKKAEALECYISEVREWPHPRSSRGVRVLAERRGMQSGLLAAEAFMLVRRVRKI